ncbi:MAG: ABC transporter substrate-binding protein, partial [Phycisphaerae bacterium]
MSTLAARPLTSLIHRLTLTAGVALTALLGACDNSSSSNANKSAPAATNAPAAKPAASEIVIGHYGSLTGPEATFGRSTDNGIKLAVEEINAAGGVNIGGTSHTIKVISEDTEGKPEKAGTVVTKLITSDKVVCVLGEVASSVTLAGAPVAQQFGV